ncbi:hypothetical protein [Priestia endophytica]|uniref:Uncharacterized protein n=1 Tax=Priestia endophytica TaxID=135735 RepID=A0AAX1QCX1_9BACI|nr:hypothetical protein [Priestia endophytica]RAS78602.1 hypothetical protein A3864_07750 [Priestia endophytica]
MPKGSNFSVPNEKLLTGIEVKEQAGHGIIDMRLIYKGKDETSDHNPFSDWVTNNPEHSEIIDLTIPEQTYAIGIEGKEQGCFGIVNFRLAYS